MKMCIILPVAAAVLWAQALCAEIAVLPYKIINPSSDFPESMGGEYSRLVSVGTLLVKDEVEVAAPREIDRDLERMKLSPQDVITQDDLDAMGKSLRIDHYLLGSLSRRQGVYRSESVLYSVRDKKVIARARVEDADLFRLAEKEIKEALVPFRNRAQRRGGPGGTGAMDVLFLLDLSYRMNRDWDPVKEAIAGFASRCVDTQRMDTRVYIVPFSDRAGYPAASVSVNSITAVRNELDRLKPAGGAGSEIFMKSLQYSVSSVKWRREAARAIIIISNSSLTSRTVEKYGIMARNRGIPINAISLGDINGDGSEVLDRLAEISGGFHAHAAYHQKLFDAAGEPVELFMENGRLFRSRFPDREWRKGLYDRGSGRSGYGKPKKFLEEIFYSEKKTPVSPYTLPGAYARLDTARIINQDPLESNIGVLVNRAEKKGTRVKENRGTAGKALLSNGSVSFWVKAPDEDFMNYFINAMKQGVAVTCGVYVKKDPDAVYGVALIPAIKGLTADYIPRVLTANLADIARRGEYYAEKGLLFPPVWFITVRVEEAERSRGGRDIRGK